MSGSGGMYKEETSMRDKILTAMKKHRLLLVFLAVAFLKQILVVGVPICATIGTPCDDELMRDWAISIARLDWMGDFNAYTFMKNPGFAIFLAVCCKLHIPYIFAVTLCYSISCMIFSTSLKNIFSSEKYVLCIYLFLLFHPVSYCSTVLQKVYRNGLGMSLALCVFGGALHMYFSVCKEKARQLLLWSAFTGLSLGYLWITKEDTIWILPFMAVICLVMFGMLLVKYRNLRNFFRYLCLFFPFLGIFLCSSGVKVLHVQRYGISSLEYYETVMEEITHIRQENPDEKIPLSRKQLKELYQISPTLAGVKEEVESGMDMHDLYDTNPGDGEVEAGWLCWALAKAFYNANVYENSETADTFYRNLHQDLDAAFADGRLEYDEVPVMQKYHMDTPVRCRELAVRALEAINYMISCKKTHVRSYTREIEGTEAGIRVFELVTRGRNAHLRLRHDYEIIGWIVFPEYDGQELNVYVEDEKGNRYQKVRFIESEDVYEAQKNKGIDLESAKECRFDTGWDEGSADNDVWYLGVYDAGQQDGGKAAVGQKIGRIRIEKDGFQGEGTLAFDAMLDTYDSQKDRESMEAAQRMPVGRLNVIGSLYRIVGSLMFYLGVLAYLVLTVLFIRGLRRKEFEYVNPWLIVTGLGLSVLVLAFGIAYVDLTQCPAVKTYYLSSGYPLLIGAELISLCKCVELVSRLSIIKCWEGTLWKRSIP